MAEYLEAQVVPPKSGELDPRLRDSPICNRLHTGGECYEMFPRDSPHLAKQLTLRVEGGLGGLKPVALHTGAMNSEWAADCVPIGAGLKFALARKYFDAVRSVPFDCNAEAARDIQDIEAAQSRRQRFCHECPEVATTARLLHEGIDAVVQELLLDPKQVFPTLYFYETGYSLHTLRQASRRSWRIGQRNAVRVKFVTCTGTMQETCLRLMGKKMLVALMMEGKFSGEGLQSLDTDEDLMSAMARELVEKAGVGACADQMWRELERERERVLPQPPALKAEEDDNPVFDLSVTEPIGPAAERAGIHLVEPQASAKVRKKSSPWSTGIGPAVQLSLFG